MFATGYRSAVVCARPLPDQRSGTNKPYRRSSTDAVPRRALAAITAPARLFEMNQRNLVVMACSLLAACSSCSQDPSRSTASNTAEDPAADGETSVQNASHEQPRPDDAFQSVEPSRTYSHVAIPEETGKCEFEERDPAERPRDFVASNLRSNVIFYQRPKGSLWSHVYADGRAIAELVESDLIVAARFGKPDLWIRPTADGVTLEAGTYRLACY